MPRQIKAHAAVLAANLLFGINYTAVQFVTPKFVQPFALNILRVGISTILFWILALFYRSTVLIKRKHLARIILCALTGVVINQLLFIKGLSMSLVIHAALLSLVTPIFITLFAAYFFKEKLNAAKVLGLAFGIAGALMLVLKKESSGNGDNIVLGDILIIINAISYAIYFILVKPLMKEYKPLNVMRWMFTLGMPLVLIVGWNQFVQIRWDEFSSREYLILVVIVIGATFLAYSFNLFSIQKLGPSLTGAYIYTQPIFASLVAVMMLNETVTLYKLIAAGFIISGVFLTSKNRNNKND